MTQDTPRKNAVIAIAKQIETFTGRKLSFGYIVGKLRKSENGGYYVEYRGQRYDGTQQKTEFN